VKPPRPRSKINVTTTIAKNKRPTKNRTKEVGSRKNNREVQEDSIVGNEENKKRILK